MDGSFHLLGDQGRIHTLLHRHASLEERQALELMNRRRPFFAAFSPLNWTHHSLSARVKIIHPSG
jgi:hypothetical protein